MILNFRMDRIHVAEVLDESFTFAPKAAARAAEFPFPPTQVVEPQDDRSLIVRFNAAGWLEMAWHLYPWGDKVEVSAPEGLRALVEGYQRPDFVALP